MTGEMRQAGNVAKFALAKRGPAQVDAPPQARRSDASSKRSGKASSSWAGIRGR
jgi:hypothetical protein